MQPDDVIRMRDKYVCTIRSLNGKIQALSRDIERMGWRDFFKFIVSFINIKTGGGKKYASLPLRLRKFKSC